MSHGRSASSIEMAFLEEGTSGSSWQMELEGKFIFLHKKVVKSMLKRCLQKVHGNPYYEKKKLCMNIKLLGQNNLIF